MDKAVVYARVSSKDQEAEGFSIPSQLKLLQEYGLKRNLKIVKEFVDVETAKKSGRTQFNHMIDLLKADPTIKHVLVEKTDRLHRNIFDFALMNDLMEKSSISIHLVKENSILDKRSRSHEKLIYGIKTVVAKHHVDNLAEEVRKGMLEKAEQGIYPSTAPYGYINAKEGDKKIIKIDPIAAAFVKKMFELYATGSYSLRALRKKMLDDGMVYRNGKNFYTSKIETILKNGFYKGGFTWCGKRYDYAIHEPIISRELFEQVQNIFNSPRKGKSRKGLFPYTNMITCGVCGCALTAEIKKGKYIYYHCTGYKGNCKQVYLKQETIEAAFDALLGDIHITEEVKEIILQGLRESFREKVEYHNNLVQGLERQIQVLQRRIDQSYLDKLDNKITEEFWQTHTKEWIAEKDQLSMKLLNAQRADANYLENATIILELAEKGHSLFKKQNGAAKRRLMNIVISNCSYKDEKLDLKPVPVFDEILKTTQTGNWCAQ